MPNWCQGYLTVTGLPEKIVEFDNKFKAKHISMETSMTTMLKVTFDESKYAGRKYKVGPYTNQFASEKDKEENITVQSIDVIKEVEDYSFINFVAPTEEDYLNGWYNWNCNNWGTKWDVCDFQDPEYDEGETNINYSFSTAWSPCEPVIAAMAKAFPELDFEYSYDESGMCFAGINRYSNGERTEELYGEGDDYRRFLKEHMEYDFCECQECKELLYRDDVEDNENKCPECGSANVLDECGKPFNEEEVKENEEERKDE